MLVVGMIVQRRGWLWMGNLSAICVVAATLAIIATHTGQRKLLAAHGVNILFVGF
ncbi:hypothetical protein C1H46_021693 [Malus baccata]|uniref:Uncharacterized protein n=1 Tax=Malus baccata TaxID=106549 RepID=A0A540M1R9_MALBA|nr:hypothetical protein C1H46_021693 [Malus baccata]